MTGLSSMDAITRLRLNLSKYILTSKPLVGPVPKQPTVSDAYLLMNVSQLYQKVKDLASTGSVLSQQHIRTVQPAIGAAETRTPRACEVACSI